MPVSVEGLEILLIVDGFLAACADWQAPPRCTQAHLTLVKGTVGNKCAIDKSCVALRNKTFPIESPMSINTAQNLLVNTEQKHVTVDRWPVGIY